MKKIIILLSLITWNASLYAASPIGVFSTSADWGDVTGMRLGEYKITFKNASAAGAGWELYYLDGFPCFGAGEYVHAWVSEKDVSEFVRVLCVRRPKEITFAYRAAKKNAPKGVTVGMLSCTVEKDLSVKLGGCEKQDWVDFAKD